MLPHFLRRTMSDSWRYLATNSVPIVSLSFPEDGSTPVNVMGHAGDDNEWRVIWSGRVEVIFKPNSHNLLNSSSRKVCTNVVYSLRFRPRPYIALPANRFLRTPCTLWVSSSLVIFEWKKASNIPPGLLFLPVSVPNLSTIALVRKYGREGVYSTEFNFAARSFFISYLCHPSDDVAPLRFRRN